jgi:DNA (cytosine-5)-methyltransferase 1
VSALKKYSVISLFSGAMGLDLGLHSTRYFNLLACVEKEPVFCQTIKANQAAGRLSEQVKIFEGDVNTISPEDILHATGLHPGELDILIGGPPCQSFSTAGKRQSIQDHRGTLLWCFLAYVKILQPKFFLMENVRGLLSASLKHRKLAERPESGGRQLSEVEQAGSVVRQFASELNGIPDASYRVDCFEVNAVNYGSPQIRERVLFFGNRFNAQISFPTPTHVHPTNLDGQLSLLENDKKPWNTLRNAIGDLRENNPELLDFSPRKKAFLDMVPQGGNWRCLPIEVQQKSMGKAFFAKGGRSGWWRRLSFDLPCPTLVTMPNHASTSLCHPQETRVLSVREYARVQEFPDEWEFCGNTAEKYAQIGNAVPLRLGKIAGELLARQLDELYERNFTRYNVTLNFFNIIYMQSHVRTRRWFKDGESIVWNDGELNNDVIYARPKTTKRISTVGA